jgi:SAM-dependent methyltransferase
MICRVCDGTNLELVINLGRQPWCNHFLKPEEMGKENVYPLHVVYCHDCCTAQLDYTVPKEVMFGDHTYLSGTTRTLREHFRQVAQVADRQFFSNVPGKSVLDIGSNDGTQLREFQSLGYDVLGVESSKTTARIAIEAGVPTENSFFNLDLARRLNRKFHLINAAGVFFHLEELHSVTDGIREALRDDGVFIVQFLYMKLIQENLAFDQIYHEHLLYYTLRSLETLLNRHGLALFDAHIAPIHGGSVVAYVTHQGRAVPSARLRELLAEEHRACANDIATYREFFRRLEVMKSQNIGMLDRAKAEGKRIFGFGAPAKGNTLLNFFGIGTQYLDCLVEKNELRRGLVSPGMHIPIVLERELTTPPDIYYVLAWNFKKEILRNNQTLLDNGVQFFFPVNPKEG